MAKLDPMRRLAYGVILLALLAAACGKKKETEETKNVQAEVVFADPAAAELAAAAARGDVAGIQKAIQEGANPSAIGDKGTSLLQWSMLNQSKSGFEALLAAGADTKHTDESGDTVMHYAAKANDPAYLDILLARKVDLDLPNTVSGLTPLMAALMGERHAQFRKLLTAGANPNAVDRAGNTTVHLAAKINENQAILDLLEAGANPLAKNRQGVTFQRYLEMTPANILSDDARQKREKVKAWLRDHGVPVEGADAGIPDAGARKSPRKPR